VSKVDLRIGNPDLYQPYWAGFHEHFGLHLSPSEEMPYLKEGGSADLKEAIRALHAKVGNAITDDRYIIVGNGATQMLFAAMEGFGVGPLGFWIQKPNWFRLPLMVNLTGSHFVSDDPAYADGEILTLPNNPNNVINQKVVKGDDFNIHDLCYNWPQYGKMFKADFPIMIFSFAKATGHAGSRIGWAIVKEKTVAERMSRYIEYTTGGVSREAQVRAAKLIDSQTHGSLGIWDRTVFEWSAEKFNERWTRLKASKRPFTLLNESGMFAWCLADDPLDMNYPFEYFAGPQCGGPAGSFRLNMGVTDAEFDRFMESLK
jgi:L-tryptophan--pyruvate aminotransferase